MAEILGLHNFAQEEDDHDKVLLLIVTMISKFSIFWQSQSYIILSKCFLSSANENMNNIRDEYRNDESLNDKLMTELGVSYTLSNTNMS